MDQYGRAFIPDLLVVRVGQVVEFRNSEDVDHNVRVIRNPAGTAVVDVSGPRNQVFRHTFAQPGSYDVSCDIHPGMRATIVAAHTPFVAIADERGDFVLKEIPTGRYALKVSATGRDIVRELEVTAPRTDVSVAVR